MDKLDQWAELIRSETARHLHHFQQKPQDYNNSLANFQMLAIMTLAYQDFGIRYNPVLINNYDPWPNSQDNFIHGVIQNRVGTCVSLPVFYVALGRRLGYPLKLVSAKDHSFARWDGRGERFNIECTSGGLTTGSDDDYRKWRRISPEEEKQSGYLQSKTPREELTGFLFTRSYCLKSCQRFAEAASAFAAGISLYPAGATNRPLGSLVHIKEMWKDWLQEVMPMPWPVVQVKLNFIRWPFLPRELESDFIYLETIHRIYEIYAGDKNLPSDQVCVTTHGEIPPESFQPIMFNPQRKENKLCTTLE